MTNQELCAWLREHSSGIYRPVADAADLIEKLLAAVQPERSEGMPGDLCKRCADLGECRPLGARGCEGIPAAPVQHDASELPPLPEWSKMDNLGGLVPSEIRTELKKYARAALASEAKADAAPKKWPQPFIDHLLRDSPPATVSNTTAKESIGKSDEFHKLFMAARNSFGPRVQDPYRALVAFIDQYIDTSHPAVDNKTK